MAGRAAALSRERASWAACALSHQLSGDAQERSCQQAVSGGRQAGEGTTRGGRCGDSARPPASPATPSRDAALQGRGAGNHPLCPLFTRMPPWKPKRCAGASKGDAGGGVRYNSISIHLYFILVNFYLFFKIVHTCLKNRRVSRDL